VGAPVAALAVTTGVVAGCWDNLVSEGQPLMFGLDAVDGRVLWQRDLGEVLPIIAAGNGLVFALDLASGGLLAVDALTGRLLSKNMAGGQYPSAPAVVGDAVCVGYRNAVQAFSARTGQQLWSYPVDGVVWKLAASSDVLYAAVDGLTSGFALYALRVWSGTDQRARAGLSVRGNGGRVLDQCIADAFEEGDERVEPIGAKRLPGPVLGRELTAHPVGRCGPARVGGVQSDRAAGADVALDEPEPLQAICRLAHRLLALAQPAGDLGDGHAGLGYHRVEQMIQREGEGRAGEGGFSALLDERADLAQATPKQPRECGSVPGLGSGCHCVHPRRIPAYHLPPCVDRILCTQGIVLG
jgi:hypothetical protein